MAFKRVLNAVKIVAYMARWFEMVLNYLKCFLKNVSNSVSMALSNSGEWPIN